MQRLRIEIAHWIQSIRNHNGVVKLLEKMKRHIMVLKWFLILLDHFFFSLPLFFKVNLSFCCILHSYCFLGWEAPLPFLKCLTGEEFDPMLYFCFHWALWISTKPWAYLEKNMGIGLRLVIHCLIILGVLD